MADDGKQDCPYCDEYGIPQSACIASARNCIFCKCLPDADQYVHVCLECLLAPQRVYDLLSEFEDEELTDKQLIRAFGELLDRFLEQRQRISDCAIKARRDEWEKRNPTPPKRLGLVR